MKLLLERDKLQVWELGSYIIKVAYDGENCLLRTWVLNKQNGWWELDSFRDICTPETFKKAIQTAIMFLDGS